jgi:hypothetical protein
MHVAIRTVRGGSAVGEEVLQQRTALSLEDTATYIHTVVQPRIAYHVKKRTDRTSLGIEGAENQPRDSRQHEGAGAHGARLESDDQRQARQPPRSQLSGRFPQREEFGVRRWIMPDLAFIARGRQNGPSLVDHHSTDRHIAVHCRQSSLIKSQLHRVVPVAQAAEFTHPLLLRRPYGTAD